MSTNNNNNNEKSRLKVENLRLPLPAGEVKAVDGVSLRYMRRNPGLVGESGCGKTVTGLSLLRLLRSPPGRL